LFRPLIFEMNAMLFPSGDQVGRPTWRVMYSISIVRLRGSTCALGFDEIFFGSVIADGAGEVWAATVHITMTMANSAHKRMTQKLKCGTLKNNVERKV